MLVTEFPSNPLLNCHDLHQLRSLANQYNFALIIDDTIGNFANIDLLKSGIADIVSTSLTKLFNGRGDAIAGSIITSEVTAMGKEINSIFRKEHSETELHDSDVSAVLYNSKDFLERSTAINRSAEELADWLRQNDDILQVYYPKFTQPKLYKKMTNRRIPENLHTPGFGGLLSIVLNQDLCPMKFYDNLDVAKGPSLGTNFTLVCPYTLLGKFMMEPLCSVVSLKCYTD